MFELFALLLIGGTLALVIAQIRRTKSPRPGMQDAEGTLLVTGVSSRPAEATGEQLVTITGALTGPTVAEHITYRQIIRHVDDWPRIGDLIPVLYPPKNPDRWYVLVPPPEPPAPSPGPPAP